jgi:hypothetical protein
MQPAKEASPLACCEHVTVCLAKYAGYGELVDEEAAAKQVADHGKKNAWQHNLMSVSTPLELSDEAISQDYFEDELLCTIGFDTLVGGAGIIFDQALKPGVVPPSLNWALGEQQKEGQLSHRRKASYKGITRFEEFGDDSTYGLSEKVNWNQLEADQLPISYFVSHSWHASRWSKLLGLVWTFHAHRSSIVACLAACVALLACALPFPWSGAPLSAASLWDDMQAFMPTGSAICAGMLLSYFVLLFHAPAILSVANPLSAMSTTSFFLDRCCIHQTNEKIKRQGILSLGNFVAASDRLLVLWDPTYFSRMWCVFELATFARVKAEQLKLGHAEGRRQSIQELMISRKTLSGDAVVTGLMKNETLQNAIVSHVDITPLHFSQNRFLSSAVIFLLCVGLVFSSFISSTMQSFFFVCLFVVHPAVSGMVTRRERAMQKECEKMLETFDISQAQATDEADRAIVLKHVESLWGTTDAFNSFVRGPLLEQIRKQGTLSCLSSYFSIKGLLGHVFPGFTLCTGALAATLFVPIGFSAYTSLHTAM